MLHTVSPQTSYPHLNHLVGGRYVNVHGDGFNLKQYKRWTFLMLWYLTMVPYNIFCIILLNKMSLKDNGLSHKEALLQPAVVFLFYGLQKQS